MAGSSSGQKAWYAHPETAFCPETPCFAKVYWLVGLEKTCYQWLVTVLMCALPTKYIANDRCWPWADGHDDLKSAIWTAALRWKADNWIRPTQGLSERPSLNHYRYLCIALLMRLVLFLIWMFLLFFGSFINAVSATSKCISCKKSLENRQLHQSRQERPTYSGAKKP